MNTIVKGAYGFTGQTVIVTGAAMGIGRGIAEVLAEAGAKVVIADVDGEKAEETAIGLKRLSLEASSVQVDVADEAAIVRACNRVTAEHGTIWGLVNNAGIADRQLLLETTSQDWDRINAINSRGVFLLTREVARAMVAAGGGGRIVNIASAALIGSITLGHAAYASSKAALLGLMRATALELAEHGITVNTVMPGGVVTPGAINAKGPPPQGPACRKPPLGMCEPRDIGAAVLFLVSPLARSITNQAIAVDGGWSVT